jgi:hypothetical protein
MLCGVDTDGTIANDNAQIIDGSAFEFALGWLQEEAFSFKEVEDFMDNALVEGKVIGGRD